MAGVFAALDLILLVLVGGASRLLHDQAVVEGRGSQFAPAIVDAFVRAMAAQPDLFGVEGPLPVALAATTAG